MKQINIKEIPRFMIGMPKFPSPETKSEVVPRGEGDGAGVGCQRGHKNAIIEQMKDDVPALIFENDAFPIKDWYTDLLPSFPIEPDIVWIGFTYNQEYRPVDENYSSAVTRTFGAHSYILVTEKGKRLQLKAAEQECAYDEKLFELQTDEVQLILNNPCFCQLPLTGYNQFNKMTVRNVKNEVGTPYDISAAQR